MTEPRIIRPNGGHIILPQRFVDVGMPASPVGMKGRYQLVKRNSAGDELQRTPWFDNLLLTSGLNRIGTGDIIAGAAVGTDNTAPNITQTALVTESTYTTTIGASAVITALGSSPYNNTRTYTYRTTLGALNGNYSEVGVGWASGAMFSRALVLDGGGSPTSISVTSAQQLDVIYQLSVYPPLVDTSNTVTISGTSYTVTGRGANVNTISGFGYIEWGANIYRSMRLGTISSFNTAFSGTLGLITAQPSGTTATGGAVVTNAYVNNSMQATGYVSYGLTAGNITGGLKSTTVVWDALAGFQYEFNPVVPKDGTKTLVLHFSLNWAARP